MSLRQPSLLGLEPFGSRTVLYIRGIKVACGIKLVQSNLGIRNFLVTLKLFLNAKWSLSL